MHACLLSYFCFISFSFFFGVFHGYLLFEWGSIVIQDVPHGSALFLFVGGRHLVLPSGTLLIANSTTRDSGTYRCTAYNPVADTRTTSPQTHRLYVSPEGQWNFVTRIRTFPPWTFAPRQSPPAWLPLVKCKKTLADDKFMVRVMVRTGRRIWVNKFFYI